MDEERKGKGGRRVSIGERAMLQVDGRFSIRGAIPGGFHASESTKVTTHSVSAPVVA